MPRFDVSDFMKKRKQLRELAINKHRAISDAEDDLHDLQRTLDMKRKRLDAKEHSVRRLDEKVNLSHFI